MSSKCVKCNAVNTDELTNCPLCGASSVQHAHEPDKSQPQVMNNAVDGIEQPKVSNHKPVPKKVIIAVLSILAIIGGFFSYVQYEKHQFVKSITPHVKNASLRLSNAIKLQTSEGSKVTFKEVLEKLELDISEIDKRILEIQTLASSGNKELTDQVLMYLNSSQELLRALLLNSKKVFSVRVAIELANKSLDDPNYYGYESNREIKESYKKEANELKETKEDVLNAAKKIKDVYLKVSSSMPKDVLADPELFDDLIKKFEVSDKKTADSDKK